MQWFRNHFQSRDASLVSLLPGMLLVTFVWIRLFLYVVDSFSWPMDGDLSFLYYIAWLMNDHDYVPYRDVHETSFFGTFIFYSTLTRLIGYTHTAFHWADLFFFSLLSAITFRLLKPFGVLCALLAIGLFGEFYFKMGVGVHLQRDFVALLPAALAILVVQKETVSILRRNFMAGILFGVAACIKPQFAGGLLVAWGYLTSRQSEDSTPLWRHACKNLGVALAGFTAVWLAGFAWLAAHGVVNEFVDMVIHYLPAYSSINGRNFARESIDAWMGAGKWLWGMTSFWMLPILGSVYGIMTDKTKKKSRCWIIALASWWFLYLTYVPMAGKYWGYHILPSYYFLALLLGLVLSPWPAEKNKILFIVIMTIWLLTYFLNIAEKSIDINHPQASETGKMEAALEQELVDYLKGRLKEGDRVQAHVTHTRGVIFPALLALKVLPVTPYLENYLLYHNVDSPFVRHARQKFLSDMQATPPRFIVYTPTLFAFHGEGTESLFLPFEKWMSSNYRLVFTPNNGSVPAFDRVEVYEYQGHH